MLKILSGGNSRQHWKKLCVGSAIGIAEPKFSTGNPLHLVGSCLPGQGRQFPQEQRDLNRYSARSGDLAGTIEDFFKLGFKSPAFYFFIDSNQLI